MVQGRYENLAVSQRILALFLLVLTLSAGPVWAEYEVLTGDYWSHDPVMIREGNTYYSFCTGQRTPIRTSTDMHEWQPLGHVWPTPDAQSWWAEEVPGFDDPPPGNDNNIWAPDISYFNGKYHLYYSISSFGSNDSCIGLATRTTLGAGGWTDEGPVICSEGTNYNAIDPALLIDDSGPTTTYWLSFGSFGTGIKMRQIDPTTGHLLASNPTLYSIAYWYYHAPIEAPFIIYREPYYYLFVSFDFCCQGANSTYNVRFGRATSVTGTYYDRNGVSMMSGGGTQITWPDERWKGPGHNAVFQDNDGTDWLLHHAYDSYDYWERSYLRIHRLYWTLDGWPSLSEPTCADVHNLGFGLASDWTQDCYVDFFDLAFLADAWLDDFDLQEFVDLGTYWLQCNNPQDANCTANW